MRITPENLETLPQGFVFVFGSNERGAHGAGAAKLAWKKFGARWGLGFGISGRAFGIPTKSNHIQTLPLEKIQYYVDRFIGIVSNGYASSNFYVTKIGCGLAGYKPEEIAPMFAPCIDMENVWLPKEFIDIINSDGSSRSVA